MRKRENVELKKTQKVESVRKRENVDLEKVEGVGLVCMGRRGVLTSMCKLCN